MESQNIEYKSTWRDTLISYNYIHQKENIFFPRAISQDLFLHTVIHNDYLSRTPIKIRICKDKICFWNDSTLPKEVPSKISENGKTREKTREKILAFIRENNKITSHELAELLSLTNKGGYWEIVSGVDK